jgi:hypothetical protein
MKSFQNDLKKGKEDELLVLPKIQKFFNRDIIKVKDEYSRYDFQDNIYKYELKSRNNNYNKFPTTIIPSDKIIDKNLILLFNFYDGLYYIEYNDWDFSNFGRNIFCREKRIGYNDKPKEYIFIPIESLKKIE